MRNCAKGVFLALVMLVQAPVGSTADVPSDSLPDSWSGLIALEWKSGIPDDSPLHQQIERAVAMRRAQGLPDSQPDQETTGFRLIHGEGDGLPGLVVDVFDDVLVVQLGTAGLARLQDAFVEGLVRTLGPRAIIDRTPPELAVEIQGHTDSTGSDEHNLDLSRRRAATVNSYLRLYGIAGDRLTTTGFGESKPVDDNATEEGRALNRRVELHRVE